MNLKMKRFGNIRWLLWCWDSGGATPIRGRRRKRNSIPSFLPSVVLLMVMLLSCNTCSAQSSTSTHHPLESPPPFATPSTAVGLPKEAAAGPGKKEDSWNTDWADSSCKKGATEIWPTYEDDPRNTSIFVAFLTTQVGEPNERLGLKIPGAFTYSVANVNENGALPEGYILRYGIYDTHGSETDGSRQLVDLLCQNVSAIFGPEHTCYVEGTIADGKNLPMLSYACSDDRTSLMNTFARINPSEINIIKATVATLLHNDWRKFSLLYNVESSTMAETLKLEALGYNMTINHEILFDMNKLPRIFKETKDTTRIYVYIGHRSQVKEVLTVMSMAGIFQAHSKKKEYLLLYVDIGEYRSGDWASYIWDVVTLGKMLNGSPCVEHDLSAYDGAFMVVTNRLPESLSTFENKVRDYNDMEPLCLRNREKYSRNRPIVDDLHIPYLLSAYLYDSVQLYVQAVQEIYKTTNGTTSVEEIARNGTKIKDYLRNKTYESILGFNVTTDFNASSEGSYSVYFFSDCNSTKSDFNCSKCLFKISDYFSENKSLMADAHKVEILDEPVCNYDNSACPQRGVEYQHVISWVMGGIFVLLTFVITIFYRNWKYEQEIMGLQWRIAVEDLIPCNHAAAGSRASLASALSYDMHGTWVQHLANYKGTIVCLKQIFMKKPELTRETMKEMRLMREIKQDNVCGFVGAYTDSGIATLVTEYCTRGSLLDILGLEDIKLDRLFISSLVHDLLRGMVYIHANFGPHGNLKSSNCVVNGRWVLQVTDYGLHDIQSEALSVLEREDTAQLHRRLLWRSPELLRAGIEERGTKEGDVYAFAIIFHEIIGRQGPFGTYEESNLCNASEIVEKLKIGYTATGAPFRPCLLELSDMPFGSEECIRNAMEASWEENPELRPTFKTLKIMLKNMKDKSRKGNIMDHMVHMMEQYSKNLEDLVDKRTHALRDEERKTKDLLHRMLPPTVAASLTKGVTVPPKGFDAVTIYFSDIVGFTALSAESTPIEVVRFLNDLYTLFDNIICWYDVYKVETIGDAYMVVSGLPKPNSGRHSGEIASMALELLHEVKHNFVIRHRPLMKLQLRIGLHTGPVMAGVVGLTMPRYCLFGDTVNTASRMESNGVPLRIHISKECRGALEGLGGYEIEERGLVKMKGKGDVLTYWLNSALSNAIQRREESFIQVQPLVLQPNDCDIDLRRRSPRLSSIGGRTASIPRSMEDLDLNGGPSLFTREGSPLPRDSPRSDISAHRRRLSSNLHASSVDHNPRGSLLCPPSDSVSNMVHQSISLDQLPHTELRFEVPRLPNNTAATSPSSSEPMLTDDKQRGVNFCPSANNEDDLVPHNVGENHPMLKGTEVEHGGKIIYEDESSHQFQDTTSKRSATIWSRLKGIFQNSHPNSRITANKLSLNGLKRESLV